MQSELVAGHVTAFIAIVVVAIFVVFHVEGEWILPFVLGWMIAAFVLIEAGVRKEERELERELHG